jgi:NAD(P)-dependent dehydrogenase (short-subunit alcohol dehydrogenase family)
MVTQLPPSQHWMYNCSKAALNLATIEFRNAEFREVAQEIDRITFWTVSPGHCKTGFNNFRGVKNPLEGAEVVVRLLASRRMEIRSGTFWEFEYGNFQQVAW